MDLRSWNKWKPKLNRQAQSFREFLGEVLDGDHKVIERSQIGEPEFAVRDDVRSLAGFSPRPGSPEIALQSIFAQLAPFFEAGFYVRRAGSGFLLRSMFLHGQVFNSHAGRSIDLGFTEMHTGEVLRGRASRVLEAFQMHSIVELESADAFAFSPVKDVVYVMICNRPHPWQVSVIESTFLVLSEIVASQELELERPQRKGFFR